MLAGSAILPLATALIAGALAARMAGSAARAYHPAKPLWALGLLMFAGASGAAAYGVADGWGEASFTVYYLAGACLCVAFLGAGSAFLALPRAVALVVLGMTITAAVGSTVTIIAADVDASALQAAAGHVAPPNGALEGLGFIWAIGMNTVGTALLIAGTVVSIVRRVRVGSNVAILVGVLIIAASGTLTRFGGEEALYVGQMVGLIVLGAGMEWAGRARYAARNSSTVAA